MMTHVLLWDGTTNELRVMDVEAMLSENRNAYRDGKPQHGVPLAWGSEMDMNNTLESCKDTIKHRAEAAA